MKTVIILLLVTLSFDCVGQIHKRDSILTFRTIKAISSYKTNDKWSKWQDVDSTSGILIVFNTPKKRIKIYSDGELTFNIISSDVVSIDNGERFEYKCVDKLGEECQLNIIYTDESIVLAVGYNKMKYAYYLKVE
jgi:hypothetical protein